MTKRNRPAGKRQSASRPPIPAVSSRGVWWRAALIAAACILTYSNSLSGAFILDDQGTIVENAQIREWWRLSSVLFPDPGSSASGRPLVNLSLAINYAFGGLGARGYHVWNIALHLVCALLLFGIVRRTLEWPRLHERFAGRSLNLACAVAVLWTVHPLNTEVVDYLTQRTESMMAMFYCLTLYAGIRAAASNRAGRWELLSVLSCTLGMACKESMVTAPVVVVLYDRIFVFGSWKQAFRARRRVYVGLAGTWIVLAALNWSGPRSAVGGFSTGVSVWTYLLNQAVMITTYLRLVIWPRPLVVFYGWPLPLTLAGVWPHALVVVLLMVATVVGLKRVPTVAFPGAWFFMTLAPTSSIIPIATEVGAERRMYVPLMAVLALAVLGASVLADGARRKRPAVVEVLPRRAVAAGELFVLGVLSVTLAAFSVVRNREYATALSLARTVVERRPSGVAHHIFAEQLTLAGRHDEAVTHLRQAVAQGDSRAGYSLAVELFNAGKLSEAIEQFEAFLRTWRLPYRLVPHWLEPLPSDVVSATMALAQAFAMQGRWAQSVEQAQRLLAMTPSNAEARLLLADALFGAQRFGEAGVQYQEYLKSRPDDVHALVNVGVTIVAGGRLDEAIVAFRRAVAVDPRNANARRVLAMALMDHGEVEEAARQAREGLALRPDDPTTRELLGRAEAAAEGGAVARRPGR